MQQSDDLPVARFDGGVVRICGQIYHRSGSLYPSANREPLYNQFYIDDGEEALQQRTTGLLYDVNLCRRTTEIIQNVLNTTNPFAASYRHLHEVEQMEQLQAEAEGRVPTEYKMYFHEKSKTSRTKNKPIHQEVAAIFTGTDGAPPKRMFVVNSRGDGNLSYLSDISPVVDPLCCPLLFPNGDLGYRVDIPHVGEGATTVRNRVTLHEYYNYRFSMRENSFDPIFHSGLLFQQFFIDAYVKIEANRLFYLRQNQSVLRVEKYEGLLDYLERQSENTDNSHAPGTPVILPSTYDGSPRSQQMRYQDAMSVVSKHGKPDLFITVTLIRNGRK